MKMRDVLFALFVLAMTALPLFAAELMSAKGRRIVTVGSAVSEAVCALGFCDEIVGTDDTSLYPDSLASRPRLGFFKRLQAEGILSLKPSLVLAIKDAGPQPALDHVRKAGVTVNIFEAPRDFSGVQTLIASLADSFGVPAKGQELLKAITADLALVREKNAKVTQRPKVLFIYARGAKTLMVAGRESAGAEMVSLSGGVPTPQSFKDYKPLTAEGVMDANPDVILMTAMGVASVGGEDGVLKLPGVAMTEAGKKRRIIVMDDLLLLGFGPRVGEAVRLLHERLFNAQPGGRGT